MELMRFHLSSRGGIIKKNRVPTEVATLLYKEISVKTLSGGRMLIVKVRMGLTKGSALHGNNW